MSRQPGEGGENRVPSVDERSQTGFTDETTERVTEPDQPLEEAEGAEEVSGIPESVARRQEAEGLTTLAEDAPNQGGRLAELMEKRKRIGLTDSEAAELGRLIAEGEGKSYWSNQSTREGESGSEG
jgi:hypothetical protein